MMGVISTTASVSQLLCTPRCMRYTRFWACPHHLVDRVIVRHPQQARFRKARSLPQTRPGWTSKISQRERWRTSSGLNEEVTGNANNKMRGVSRLKGHRGHREMDTRGCLKGKKVDAKKKNSIHPAMAFNSTTRSGCDDGGRVSGRDGSEAYRPNDNRGIPLAHEGMKTYATRRRDPRVNGSDLYVARFTKQGLTGSAKPCRRCLEWCRWAGVKRIFHWDPTSNEWAVLKVSEVERAYQTHADSRIKSRTFVALA